VLRLPFCVGGGPVAATAGVLVSLCYAAVSGSCDSNVKPMGTHEPWRAIRAVTTGLRSSGPTERRVSAQLNESYVFGSYIELWYTYLVNTSTSRNKVALNSLLLLTHCNCAGRRGQSTHQQKPGAETAFKLVMLLRRIADSRQ
jgi:hypothetical protein